MSKPVPPFARAVYEAALTLRMLAERNGDPGNFSGEDLRMVLSMLERAPSVPHANSWGPIIRTLAETGIIQRNGGMKHMRSRSSHGRLTPTYSWIFHGSQHPDVPGHRTHQVHG